MRLVLRVAVLVAILVAVLMIAYRVVRTPWQEWNDPRIAPSAAILSGYELYYPEGEGPRLGAMYGPFSALFYVPAVIIASTPSGAIWLGSAASFLIVTLPVLWLLAFGSGNVITAEVNHAARSLGRRRTCRDRSLDPVVARHQLTWLAWSRRQGSVRLAHFPLDKAFFRIHAEPPRPPPFAACDGPQTKAPLECGELRIGARFTGYRMSGRSTRTASSWRSS